MDRVVFYRASARHGSPGTRAVAALEDVLRPGRHHSAAVLSACFLVVLVVCERHCTAFRQFVRDGFIHQTVRAAFGEYAARKSPVLGQNRLERGRDIVYDRARPRLLRPARRAGERIYPDSDENRQYADNHQHLHQREPAPKLSKHPKPPFNSSCVRCRQTSISAPSCDQLRP